MENNNIKKNARKLVVHNLWIKTAHLPLPKVNTAPLTLTPYLGQNVGLGER